MDTSSTPPLTDLGDVALWALVRGDDADAFAAAFDRHQARVHRHARRWTVTPHDADDLVAAVFLEAWRRREDVSVVDGSVLPWLLAAANNVQRNRARSAVRGSRAMERLRRRSATSAPDHADDVAELVDAERRADTVRRAFARLDPIAQDVLTLCVLEDHPMAAAAEVLGCPVGTVKSRLNRARRSLRRALEDTAPDAPVTALPSVPAASPVPPRRSDTPRIVTRPASPTLTERTASCP